MKKLSSVFGLLALAATFAAGCVDEDPNYNNGGNPTDEPIGYLALGNLDLNVVVDTDQNTDKNISSTRAAQNPNFTAGDEAATTDDYYVKILPAEGGEAPFAGLFKDLKAQIETEKADNGQGMALPVGTYTVKAWSNRRTDRTPELLQSTPSYMGSTAADKPLTIVKGQVAEPVKVTCTLVNIKVTVEIEESLRKNQAGESILDIEEVWVNLGETKFIYKDADGWDAFGISGEGDAMKFDGPTKPVYFRAVNAENMLQFHFRATPTGGSTVTLNKNIPAVKGGHWRKIKVVGKHDTQGNLTFDIEVSTLVQDETIHAGDDAADPSTSSWAEDTMVDPDDAAAAPKVEWQGGDVNADIQVGASNPSANTLTIRSVNKIASIALAAETTNSDFASDFESLNVTDLCAIESSRMLTRYGIPFGSGLVGKEELSFSLDNIMNELRTYNGRYVFTLEITDRKGFKTTQALTFVVGDAPVYTQPLIEWSEGEFDKDVTLRSDMQINIKLTAQPSFKSIKVEIISEELGPEMLELVPLQQTFDLCDLQDFTASDGSLKTAEEQAKALTDKNVLGLIDVVNEDLKQRSEANFVITPFVPIIMNTFESGKFYFRLTVVDADNNSTTKTLQLVK